MNSNSFIVNNKQIELDSNLIPYDLWATKVHVLMLTKQKIIGKGKAKKILKALLEIENEFRQEKFTIDQNKGLHLTVEAKVIEKIGTDGYFMHTGRSRNDQIMTAELLYLREKALEIFSKLLQLLKVLFETGEKHIETVMPGYTHMQPAKPTTFGQWCLAYHDMFHRCAETFVFNFDKFNLCPLGSVESYGTSWNIDRFYTAKLLGFPNVWEIPQEAISSRGFAQLAYMEAIKNTAIVISKIAADLLLFTTFEYGYISLSSEIAQQMGMVTGSSVMPQKKNPDVLELLRSLSPQIIGYESILGNILSGLPMGYNRDTREIKEYIESGLGKAGNSLTILTEVLETIIIHKNKMFQAVLDNYSLATDLSDYIAQKSKVPYRKAYKTVGTIVKELIAGNIPINNLPVNKLVKIGKEMKLDFSITSDELKNILNPFNLLMKRKHIGGASATVMEKMIDKRKDLQTEDKKWLQIKWEKIKSAKQTTEQIINNLLNEKD